MLFLAIQKTREKLASRCQNGFSGVTKTLQQKLVEKMHQTSTHIEAVETWHEKDKNVPKIHQVVEKVICSESSPGIIPQRNRNNARCFFNLVKRPVPFKPQRQNRQNQKN